MRFNRLLACFIAATTFVSVNAYAQMSANPMHSTLSETAQTKDCLMCHQSYEAVAAKTEKMQPNPHSNHRGEQNCTNCHKVKGAPHFECNDCHEFNIKMKGAK